MAPTGTPHSPWLVMSALRGHLMPTQREPPDLEEILTRRQESLRCLTPRGWVDLEMRYPAWLVILAALGWLVAAVLLVSR